MKIVEGNLIDVVNREIYPCAITISEGRIVSIERNSNSYNCYISPGLVDSHVHVHSIPRIFELVCRLAKEYGIRQIRTQYEKPYIIPDVFKHTIILKASKSLSSNFLIPPFVLPIFCNNPCLS